MFWRFDDDLRSRTEAGEVLITSAVVFMSPDVRRRRTSFSVPHRNINKLFYASDGYKPRLLWILIHNSNKPGVAFLLNPRQINSSVRSVVREDRSGLGLIGGSLEVIGKEDRFSYGVSALHLAEDLRRFISHPYEEHNSLSVNYFIHSLSYCCQLGR